MFNSSLTPWTSPPGSSVPGILQARILGRLAMPSSRDCPDSGIEPVSPALAGGFFTTEPPGKPREAQGSTAAAAKSLQSCPTLCDAMNVRPYGQQPTRPLCPQDSLGKNTGVGCHCLLQCMKVKSESEAVSDSSQPHGPQPTRLLYPWDFPGKSTGAGCHCLLHTIM